MLSFSSAGLRLKQKAPPEGTRWGLGSQGLTLHSTLIFLWASQRVHLPTVAPLTGVNTCRHIPGGETIGWRWIQTILDALDALGLDRLGVVIVRLCPFLLAREINPSSQVGAKPPFPSGSRSHPIPPSLPRWITVLYVSWAKFIGDTQTPDGTERKHLPCLCHHMHIILHSNPSGGFPFQSEDTILISEKINGSDPSYIKDWVLICKWLWVLHSSGTMDFGQKFNNIQ